jgi:hypothetical protein
MDRMTSGIAHRRFRTMGGALLGLATAFALSASVTLASPPGNNGTVKIHDGATDTEPIIKNEPQVCTFHLHFFFADPTQSGTWWIQSWPPTGDMTTVLSGSYSTDSTGQDRQPPSGVYTLDNGHYKLFWTGDESNLIKHKVFWVNCPPEVEKPTPMPPGGGAAITPTPFNGATDPSSRSGGNTTLALALLLSGGSAFAFVLLRPFPRRIGRD